MIAAHACCVFQSIYATIALMVLSCGTTEFTSSDAPADHGGAELAHSM